MKILYVITGLGVGGAERQVVDVVDRLADLGHSVKIAYLTGPKLTTPASKNIDLIGFRMTKGPMGFAIAYVNLRKLIIEFSPDVVHSHMVHANLLCRLIRLTCRMQKLVCTAHNSNEGGAMRMWGYRLTAPLANVTTNVSAEAVSAFEAKGAVAAGTMLAICNGIDTQRFRPSAVTRGKLRQKHGVSSTDKVILAVGRLNEAKDYPNLLNAFSIVLQSSESVHLWIVGDGDLRQELMSQVNSLGMQHKVCFMGVQNNVEEWMNAADVFVLSSAWEGFGLVVAEAMACEKVVVATDAGGVKEVLGDCGFLVPTRDPVALSNALKNALSLDQSVAFEMGVQARKRVVSLYSIENVVERWLNVYGLAGAHFDLKKP